MTRPVKSTVTFKQHAKFVAPSKSIYIQRFKLNEQSTEAKPVYLPCLFAGQGGEKMCSQVAFLSNREYSYAYFSDQYNNVSIRWGMIRHPSLRLELIVLLDQGSEVRKTKNEIEG
jgi:hypothetical protein